MSSTASETNSFVKKQENVIYNQEKKQSKIDPQATQILELPEKDIIKTIKSMLRRQLERIDIVGENVNNYKR